MSSHLNRPYRLALVPLLTLLIAGWLLAGPAWSSAAPATQVLPGNSTACHPVDVVLLIDQSDSMRQTNDPDGSRFDAAATVIEYLGNHALWLCRDQAIKHRVTVIGFGDYPVQTVGSGVDNPYSEDVEFYLTDQIVPVTDDFRQWVDELTTNIGQPIEAAKVGALGATDPYAALLAARDQLTTWRNEPLGDLPRRQSVVIITDGEPCLFARGCGTVPIYNIDPDMSALSDLTNPLDDAFPWMGADNEESVHISLIAMSQRSGSMQARFFQGWQEITQAHGGDLFNANDLNTNLNVIATDIMGPVGGSGMEPVACNTDVWVNPYTDNLVIVYAAGLGAQNTLADNAIITIDTGDEVLAVAGGQATAGDVPVTEYLRQGRNEYYIFQPPIPGRYNIGYTGADLNNCSTLMDIRATSKPVIAEVTAPTAGASFPAVTPPSAIAGQRFRLEVFESVGQDSERVPLVEFEDYPIDVTASVSGPGGHAGTYNFAKVADGVYESTELIASPTVGDYTWNLRATVRTLNPDQPELLILEDEGSFSATEVLPFGFVITGPADGAVVPLNTVDGPTQIPEPIAVAINLVDSAGAPADASTYLTDDSDLFTASLVKGDQVIETIALTATPGSAGEFRGVLTNSAAGGVVAPGEYSVRVSAAWSPQNYNPLVHTPAIDEAAVAINQFEVVPLKLRINGPGETTVHVDNWLGAVRGQVRPVDFSVEVVNAVTEEALDLQQVLRDPEATYQAAIVPPSGNPIVVPLSVLSNENFQLLQAEGGAAAVAEAGQYAIKLETAAIALNDRFAWADAEASVPFTRQDTTFTSPTTWRIILGTAAALLLALLGWIVYLLTGGPSGYVALHDMSTRREIPLRSLRSSPRVNTIKSAELTDRGVKHLKVRRGEKDEDGHRTVIVTAAGTEGEDYMDAETLADGQLQSFLPSAEIIYHSR